MLHIGEVIAFDHDRGIGTVRAGTEHWDFHCTVIADGTRTIDVGTRVAFSVGPGGPGRWEAFEVTRVDESG